MSLSTRQIAKMRGNPHYTGSNCGKHPDVEGLRYSANGRCVKCAQKQDRARKDRIKNDKP